MSLSPDHPLALPPAKPSCLRKSAAPGTPTSAGVSLIPGAVREGGGHPMVLPPDGRDLPFDALTVFESCVEIAAARRGLRAPGT
jgi:hypothetical protein